MLLMLMQLRVSFYYPYSAGKLWAGPLGLPVAAGGGVVVSVGGVPNAGAGAEPNAGAGEPNAGAGEPNAGAGEPNPPVAGAPYVELPPIVEPPNPPLLLNPPLMPEFIPPMPEFMPICPGMPPGGTYCVPMG